MYHPGDVYLVVKSRYFNRNINISTPVFPIKNTPSKRYVTCVDMGK